jgi:choline-sulfatase
LYEGEEIEIPEFPPHLEATYSALDRWLNTYHGAAKAENLRDPDSIYRVRRAYYALVTYIDRKVGELLASLEENGFQEDTVVIFTSDHGDMLCERGMVQKRTFYEWSSRVPLILRFPGGWQEGTIRPEPVSLIDLVPTLLDLAGVGEEERLPLDGRSLRGLLDGSDAGEWEAFSEYHSQGAHAPCFMIRRGRYKYVLIHGYDSGYSSGYGSQLFDLKTDPGEWSNLAGRAEYAEIEQHLKARVLEQFDPDGIERAVTESVRKRDLIKRAMGITGTRWDVEPRFDPTKGVTDQYLPGTRLAEIPR